MQIVSKHIFKNEKWRPTDKMTDRPFIHGFTETKAGWPGLQSEEGKWAVTSEGTWPVRSWGGHLERSKITFVQPWVSAVQKPNWELRQNNKFH